MIHIILPPRVRWFWRGRAFGPKRSGRPSMKILTLVVIVLFVALVVAYSQAPRSKPACGCGCAVTGECSCEECVVER